MSKAFIVNGVITKCDGNFQMDFFIFKIDNILFGSYPLASADIN